MRTSLLFILLASLFLLLSSSSAWANTYTLRYSYDKTYQVKKVAYNNISTTYNYDDAGNITSVSRNSSNQDIPPLSSITSPVNGAVIAGVSCTITGTAIDITGSGISDVKVSLDGGMSWKGPPDGVIDTSGNGSWTSWSYNWTLPSDGAYTLKSKAANYVGNTEIPGDGNSVLVNKTAIASGAGSGLFILPDGLFALDTVHHYDDAGSISSAGNNALNQNITPTRPFSKQGPGP